MSKHTLNKTNTSIQLLMLMFLFAAISQQLLAVNRGRFSKPVFTPDKDTPYGLNDKTGEVLKAEDLSNPQGTFGLTHKNCTPTNWLASVPTSQPTWTILSDCVAVSNGCSGLWVSSKGTYTVGRNEAGPPLPSLLTDTGPLYSKFQISENETLALNGTLNDYAFFAHESKPYIIIDLGGIKKCDSAYILNARNPKYWSNLQGLKISFSGNGKTFKKAWQHKPVKPTKLSFGDTFCNIPDLNVSWKLQPVRYIRIENTSGSGGLALRRVFVYNSTRKKTLNANVERPPRTWTSTSGATINASLLEESGRFVVLKRNDGSTVKIPTSKLSKTDRAHIEKLKSGK